MTTSQAIISTIAVFVIIRTFIHYKSHHFSALFSFLWLLVWVSILIFALYPGFLSRLATLVGIGRGVDLATYLSIIALLYLIYLQSSRIKTLEHQVTRLARFISLQQVKTSQSKFKKKS